VWRLSKESEILKGVLAKGNPSKIEENPDRLVRQILQKLRVVLAGGALARGVLATGKSFKN
jgi:hypothetical protein